MMEINVRDINDLHSLFRDSLRHRLITKKIPMAVREKQPNSSDRTQLMQTCEQLRHNKNDVWIIESMINKMVNALEMDENKNNYNYIVPSATVEDGDILYLYFYMYQCELAPSE